MILVLLTGCNKGDMQPPDISDDLTGYWINPVINDTLVSYSRAHSLKENDYGFAFRSGHVFIERKNAGWCGTPPISYADFDGSWIRKDSLIEITVGYWGGTADYRWKIISVEADKLTVSRFSEEYHQEINY